MEKFEPKNIKGAFDYLPKTMIRRNSITDILRRNFEVYGYLPLETAQLNYYDLLSYKYEDNAEILREIYKLKDQGERELGLRFDLTVPFCKVIAMNRNLRLPFKRYEIGKVWRNGPVKLGRTREFIQCDVDCVGVSGVHIESELITLAIKSFLEIGIEPQVQIGNRKLLSALIANCGVDNSKTDTVIGILDKLGKVTAEETTKELAGHINKDRAETLVKYCSLTIEQLEQKFSSDAQVADALGEVRELWRSLGGNSTYCAFTPSLARGLNIYTGTVWEVFDKKGRIASALGGGGRYDNIITNFIDNGQKYPAVGMSFGLEPIMAVLTSDETKPTRTIDLMIIPMQTETYCSSVAEGLRANGLRVLVHLGGKSVGKCMEYANAENIPYTAVLGENEVKSGEITVKNMQLGTNKTFSTNDTKNIKEFIVGG